MKLEIQIDEKKQLRKALKQLEQRIETETKAKIKINFDYQIPIAERK